MPYLPARPCREPGCPRLTTHRLGYCEDHLKAKRAAYDSKRSKDAERKVYQSGRWTSLSRQYRQENPLCERCEAKGNIVAAALVHHKLPIAEGGDPWAWDNLESVCRGCHAIEEEHRAFAPRRDVDPYKRRRLDTEDASDMHID